VSEPLIVVKGKPDGEELAALMTALAIVSARAAAVRAAADRDALAAAGGRVPTPQSRWRSGPFGLRHGPLPRGAGAWRAALLRP
jgi:hypothetical protein